MSISKGVFGMDVSVKVFCNNCHNEGSLEIKLGTTKEEALKHGQCQHCNVVGRLESISN